jgi:hypothetical protein
MKYTVNKLDARYSYHQWFSHYIGFSSRMSNNKGPLEFNQVLQWLVQTYGWSAEVKQYQAIYEWYNKSVPLMSVNGGWVRSAPKNLPPEVNPHWSWSNQYEELRIYVRGDEELAFFQLAHPNNV